MQHACERFWVGSDRAFNRAGDRTRGGLVQHVVDAFAGLVAGLDIPDILFYKHEPLPLLVPGQPPDLVKVMLKAGGEVIRPHNLPGKFEQGFKQVGTDKTGHPGEQPCFELLLQLRPSSLFVLIHGIESGKNIKVQYDAVELRKSQIGIRSIRGSKKPF